MKLSIFSKLFKKLQSRKLDDPVMEFMDSYIIECIHGITADQKCPKCIMGENYCLSCAIRMKHTKNYCQLCEDLLQ